MSLLPPYPFYDEDSDIHRNNSGDLPHWTQPGKIHFITFRLGDSLPASVELTKPGTNTASPNKAKEDKTNTALKHFDEVENVLSHSYGECWLKDRETRRLLVDSFKYRNHVDYEILSYVIMPNHVHLLISIIGENSVEKIMKVIKSFSARQINVYCGRTGKLWQRENYDHIVRNKRSLIKILAYIQKNPYFLPPSEYALYTNPELASLIEHLY